MMAMKRRRVQMNTIRAAQKKKTIQKKRHRLVTTFMCNELFKSRRFLRSLILSFPKHTQVFEEPTPTPDASKGPGQTGPPEVTPVITINEPENVS